MKLYENVTQEIDEFPRGPKTVAFFDFDGTVIFGYSVASMFLERVLSGQVSVRDALQQFSSLLTHALSGSEYSRLLQEVAAALKGVQESQLSDLGARVFEKYLARAIYPESRALIKAHQRRGHTVAILSSATPYQIGPIADELGVRNVLCNHLQTRDGRFTGELRKPLCYAEGKLAIARKFAARHKSELAASFFYSDGFEDLPLLQAVGMPRPLNPDFRLAEEARHKRWPVRRFDSRGFPGFREVVRTGLVYGAFVSAALQIVPTWILNQSRRDAVNLAVTAWGEFGSALAGMRIRVRGEQHLWAQRPAVFLFNHQSAIDVLIIAKLLRRDFTAIAKQEIARNPLVGPVFRVADTVFVDRRNQTRAIEALRPVVDTLRGGLSVAIAPEGTRSAGDRLGEFKKGPFHIAMQAGVPVVPIVIHNAADVLPKGGFFVRPAVVHVDVLEPIATENWRAETIGSHVAEIRQRFLEALGQQTPERAELRRVR